MLIYFCQSLNQSVFELLGMSTSNCALEKINAQNGIINTINRRYNMTQNLNKKSIFLYHSGILLGKFHFYVTFVISHFLKANEPWWLPKTTMDVLIVNKIRIIYPFFGPYNLNYIYLQLEKYLSLTSNLSGYLPVGSVLCSVKVNNPFPKIHETGMQPIVWFIM